jgi:hypothetical protein
MRSLANLTSLRSAVIDSDRSPSLPPRCASKSRASNSEIGAAPLRREQRAPRRRDVVADGRDEADARDRDAALAFSIDSAIRHCISSRAPATVRPPLSPASSAFAMPSTGGLTSIGEIRAAWPGVMNERIFTCVT